MAAHLPRLTNEPIQHQDCCASLSSRLLNNIINVLRRDGAFVASIGCGSGLLEALLLQDRPSLRMLGVEVASCNVEYLPLDNVCKVSGTWEICADVLAADTWLIVYPRAVKLVAEYLGSLAALQVQTLIWIGPTRDWADFQPAFQKCTIMDMIEVKNPGLASYETMVVMTKRSAVSDAENMGENSTSHVDAIDEI